MQNPDIGATVAAEPYAPEGASPLSVLSTLPDPSDLPALQKALDAADPERRLLPLGLHRMIIDADAVPMLAEVVAGELDRAGREGGDVVVLTDDTPITRDGEDLTAQVRDLLGERFSVRPVVLRGSHATLHVDDEAMDAASDAATDAACVVTVGGGTITDIGKVALARAGSGDGGSRWSWCRPRPRWTASPTTSRCCCATA